MRSDGKAALGIVFDQLSSAAQKALAELAGHVGTTVAPRIPMLGHTVGHSGHPWNELADTLCDHKSRDNLPSDCNLDWLIRRHRSPLRLVGCDFRLAPVLLNSFQSVPTQRLFGMVRCLLFCPPLNLSVTAFVMFPLCFSYKSLEPMSASASVTQKSTERDREVRMEAV